METQNKEINNLKNYLIELKGYKSQQNEENKFIENSMFRRVIALLKLSHSNRAQDEKKYSKMNYNTFSKEEEKINQELEKLNELKENAGNYIIPELMLFIMSSAHNDWIVSNFSDTKEKELNNKNTNNKKMIEQKDRFVQFELLNKENLKKYSSVLFPIFDALEIEYDEKDVINQFDRKQLVYMLKNGIFSGDSLKENLQNLDMDYLEIYGYKTNIKENVAEKIKDFIKKNDVAESVQEKLELNFVENFKRNLKSDSKDIGIFYVPKRNQTKLNFKFDDSIMHKKIGFKKMAYPHANKPIPKVLFDLSVNTGLFFAENLNSKKYEYINFNNQTAERNLFLSYDECSDEQKRHINRREKKVDKFVKKIENSDSKKYSEKGLVTIVMPNSFENKVNVVQIEMSKKDLAECRILPSEIGWCSKKKALINSSKNLLLSGNVETSDNIVHEKRRMEFTDKINDNSGVSRNSSIIRNSGVDESIEMSSKKEYEVKKENWNQYKKQDDNEIQK